MKFVVYEITLVALLVVVGIVVWSLGLPKCTLESPRGPTIGGIMKIAGC